MVELVKNSKIEGNKVIIEYGFKGTEKTYPVTINAKSPIIYMLGTYSKQAENGKLSEEEAGEKLIKSVVTLLGGDNVIFELVEFGQENDYYFTIDELLKSIVESIQSLSEGADKEKKDSKKG